MMARAFFCAPSTRIGLSNKMLNPVFITVERDIMGLVLKNMDLGDILDELFWKVQL